MKTLFRFVAVVCLVGLSLTAQETPPLPGQGSHRIFSYDANGNVEYICWANTAVGTTATFVVSAKTLTSIVDSSNTATVTTVADHGLTAGATVVVSGATGDTDLNGTYTILTVPTSKTFTFTSASVTDATYNETTLTVTYSGPQLTDDVWAIQKFFYCSGSADPWAGCQAANQFWKAAWASGSQARNKVCADRATYVYR